MRAAAMVMIPKAFQHGTGAGGGVAAYGKHPLKLGLEALQGGDAAAHIGQTRLSQTEIGRAHV